MRGSSTGRKPTSGMSRRLASSRSEPYDCVNAPTLLVEALAGTPRRAPRRAARASARPARSRPCSSTIRTARSNATHAITFECVKWRRGPRTSQIPSSGSRQTASRRSSRRRQSAQASSSGGEPGRARLVERVEDLAVDVELELRARRRCRRGPAASPRSPSSHGELELGDPALAGDPVQRLRPVGRARDRAQQPVAPRARLVVVAGADEREERERRVAHPAEAVVPVPDAAERLRQRRGRRRDDPAGRRVRQRLERDERADQRVAVRPLVRAAVRPVVARTPRCPRAPPRRRRARAGRRSTGYQVRTNGTRSPGSTSNSATVCMFSPTSSTGDASRSASGPAIASVPSRRRRTHGTIEP